MDIACGDFLGAWQAIVSNPLDPFAVVRLFISPLTLVVYVLYAIQIALQACM